MSEDDGRDEDLTDYEVGYRKPPTETRFKKGQSGNPGGQPKRPPTLEDRIEAQRKRKIRIKRGDKVEEVRGFGLHFRQMFARAIKSYADAKRLVEFVLAHYPRRLSEYLPVGVREIDIRVDEELLGVLRNGGYLRGDATMEDVVLEELRDAYDEYSESLPDARTHRERLDE